MDSLYNSMIILSLIFFICIVISVFCGYNYVRLTTLAGMCIALWVNVLFFVLVDLARLGFQFITQVSKLVYVNVSYEFGLDGFGMCLLALSTFLLIVCVLSYWYAKYQLSYYCLTMSVSLWIFHHVFTVLDLILFYFAFEAILAPMFILLGVWGSRERKLYAAYHLFLYTLAGSFFMMVAFFDIYLHTGSTSIFVHDIISGNVYHGDRVFYIWCCLMIAFIVKIPLVPFHIWLPEAHVEAPTPGSILLAGVLLKLGSYGIMRFVYSGPAGSTNPEAALYVFTIATMSYLFASLVAFNQQDMKKILAYSSVAHMSYSLMGLFAGDVLGFAGFGYIMVAHGLTASAFFYIVGMLYERHKSRLLFYYGGLVELVPRLSFGLFLIVLANIAFPATCNFVGELLVTYGIVQFIRLIPSILLLGLILTLIYSLFMFVRVCFGIIKQPVMKYYADMTRIESYLLYIFLFMIFATGLAPDFIYRFFQALIYYIFP